jgi:tetratricopeptide (TPR) repeat protein
MIRPCEELLMSGSLHKSSSGDWQIASPTPSPQETPLREQDASFEGGTSTNLNLGQKETGTGKPLRPRSTKPVQFPWVQNRRAQSRKGSNFEQSLSLVSSATLPLQPRLTAEQSSSSDTMQQELSSGMQSPSSSSSGTLQIQSSVGRSSPSTSASGTLQHQDTHATSGKGSQLEEQNRQSLFAEQSLSSASPTIINEREATIGPSSTTPGLEIVQFEHQTLPRFSSASPPGTPQREYEEFKSSKRRAGPIDDTALDVFGINPRFPENDIDTASSSMDYDLQLSQPFDDWAIFNLNEGIWNDADRFVNYVKSCVPPPALKHFSPKGMLDSFQYSAKTLGTLDVRTLMRLSELEYELISWCSNDSVLPVVDLINLTLHLSTNLELNKTTQLLHAAVSTTYAFVLIEQLDQEQEAQARLQNVVSKCVRVLGADHQQTLKAKRGLSVTLYKQGKLDAALGLANQTLEASIKTNGEEHCDTAWNMAALARVYQTQNRKAEIIELRKRAFNSCNKRLGPGHPNTQYALFTLGRALLAQGKIVEAEQFVSQSVAQRTEFLGEFHQETLVAKFWLARILFDLGHHFEGEKLAYQVLDAQQQTHSMAQSDYLGFTLRLAATLEKQSRRQEAAHLVVPILPVLSSVFDGGQWGIFVDKEWRNFISVYADGENRQENLSVLSIPEQLSRFLYG